MTPERALVCDARQMRLLISLALLALLALAVVAGLLAWGALDNLFRGYRDSPVSTYLVIGLPALVVCLVALGAVVRLWR